MIWDGSDRRNRLPADWRRAIRPRILRRDKLCRCRGCPQCSDALRACARPSTDVDHIVAGDDHSDANLQGLCHPCHKHKTGAERERLTTRRPPPRHPGLK